MDGPFTMLRALPNRPTQRVCKLSNDLEAVASEQDSWCFPGADAEQQLMLNAFQDCWQELLGKMKELQHHTMSGVLKQLQQWLAQTSRQQLLHLQPQQTCLPGGDAGASPRNGLQDGPASSSSLLPTAALSLASSTNTAEAYAHILCALKQQGHPAALVSARETGTGVAAVINSALRQFLSSATPADDMPALLAWWRDELQRCSTSSTTKQTNKGPRAAATGATPSKGHCASEDDTHAVAMDVDKAPAATPQRQLRSRAAASTPAAAASGAATCRDRGGHAHARPPLQVPVLVLQDVDSVDAEALEELVVLLHEARQMGLPLVLVLGISMSHHGLLQLLPNNVMRRIQLLQLSLPPAWQQLARLYRAVLLSGPQPSVVLGPGCAVWLLEHFRDVDASASMVQRSLQVACVQHFLQQPLSCLAGAAAGGSRRELQAAIKALPRGQLRRCLAALASSAQALLQADAAHLPASTAAADASAPAGSSNCSMMDAAAARSAALAHLQAAVSSSQGCRRGDQGFSDPPAAAAAAAAVLEGAVWAAMTSFQQWRMGVLMLSLIANFTGAAEADASFQVPALYAAAQQPTFLTTTKHGVLSTCGSLLLKLLGSSSCGDGNGGRSWPARAGVVPVDELTPAECAELLQKLLQLLQSAQRHPRAEGSSAQLADSNGQSRRADSSGQSSSHSEDSSSEDSASEGSEDESEGGSSGPCAGGTDQPALKQTGQKTALAGSRQAQQLVQALEALHATVASAAPLHDTQQPQPQQMQQGLDGGEDLERGLASFRSTFTTLLALLPEQQQLPPAAVAAAAAAPAGDGSLDGLEDAAAFGVYSTPAGPKSSRAGTGSAHTPQLTPGGLASQLRKRVRFAPDTPDHAGAKAAGASSSAKSTPDDDAAPGLIKTPNKRGGSSSKKPRKKLFDNKVAAAAAAAAAADGKPRRSSRRDKQQAEVGDIAGSSAAALAAVAAAAASGGVAAAGSSMGNKRHARLMGLMANTFAGSPNGVQDHSPAPRAAPQQQQQHQQAGLLLSPIVGSAGAAVAGCSPESVGPSPPPSAAAAAAAAAPGRSRLRNGSNNASPAAGNASLSAAAVAAAAAGTGVLMSPVRGRASADGAAGRARSSSRLSRRSTAGDQPPEAVQQLEGAAMQDDGEEQTQQEAAQGAQQVQTQAQEAAAAAAAPHSCGAILARLLAAAIPKLLLDWCHPASKDSVLYEHLSSSILQPTNSSSASSADDTVAAVAAGTSLAVAGAAAFVFDNVQALEQHLVPAAPAATHLALVAPGLRLASHPSDVGMQGWEDTCLAYVLLQQQRDDGLPVSDWFGLFCEALRLKGFQQGAADASGADADMADADAAGARGGGAAEGVVGAAAGRALRSRARAGRKGRGYADARGAAAAEAAAASTGGSSGGQTPGRRGRQQQDQAHGVQGGSAAAKTGKKRGSLTAAVACNADKGDQQQQQEVDQQELLAAAARFSQAAAELQLLGVWKGTKRRRAAGVLRVFAPEGPGLPSMAAAAAVAAADAAGC